MRPRRLRNCAGLTLVEILVAAAILAIVITMALTMLVITQNTYVRMDYIMRLESEAQTGLRNIAQELPAAANVLIPAHNQRLTFQIPIDWDQDGTTLADGTYIPDVLDASGAIEYGYHLMGAVPAGQDPKDWCVSYVWVPLEAGPDGILGSADDDAPGPLTFLGADGIPDTDDDHPAGPLSEQIDNVDYNMDGDLMDKFIIGRIDQVVYSVPPGGVVENDPANEVSRITISEGVIQTDFQTLGDIDQPPAVQPQDTDVTAPDDPLFFQTGNDVIIELFLVAIDGDGNPQIRRVRTRVTLRNLAIP